VVSWRSDEPLGEVVARFAAASKLSPRLVLELDLRGRLAAVAQLVGNLPALGPREVALEPVSPASYRHRLRNWEISRQNWLIRGGNAHREPAAISALIGAT
jgi:hypothetical protein